MLQILPIQVLVIITDSSSNAAFQSDVSKMLISSLSHFRNLMKAGLNVR